MKSGKSIGDEHVGPLARGLATQRAQHLPGSRQHAHRLDESGDGEAAIVADQPRAGGLQPAATEAEGGDVGIDRAHAPSTSAPA